MSILGYEPTASFSFEFRMRQTPTVKLTESFFLLPPTEYSMQEGFRVTVNKTIGGAWVDDFGNDYKKITLGGELYSYYFGQPQMDGKLFDAAGGNQTPWGRGLQSGVAGARQIVGSATRFNLPIPGFGGLSGMSGLDEFFKLRYLVSRFRDTYISESDAKYLSTIGKVAPAVKKLQQVKSEQRNWRDIMVIYHDYDDNNHFEVIFDDFSFKRNAGDPHTVAYTIAMTAIRELPSSAVDFGLRSFVNAKRENPYDAVNKWAADLTEATAQIVDLTVGQLFSVMDAATKVGDACTALAGQLSDVVERKVNEFSAIMSAAKLIETASNGLLEDLLVFTTGGSIESVAAEDFEEELPDNVTQAYKVFETIKQVTEEIQAIDKVFKNFHDDAVYSGTESEVVTEEEFSVTSDTSKNMVRKAKLEYEVQQGDTVYKVANRFYGDYSKAGQILDANGLQASDFENEAMVGKIIVIPISATAEQRTMDNNLVWSVNKQFSDPSEKMVAELGTDIALDDSRAMFADGSGDLPIERGFDCYLENIMDRLSFRCGALNPVHPEWGVEVPVGVPAANITIQRIMDNIEAQASLDPRTEYAYVDKTEYRMDGDTLQVTLKAKPFLGTESRIQVGDIVAGLIGG